VNAPVVSGTKGILNLGATYWRTAYSGTSFPDLLYSPLEQRGLHSAGINSTLFKPLNEKNLLIVQASLDGNALVQQGASPDSLMWGLGVSRTYRMGRLIHVPVLLYNRTFNDRWGLELLLPARGVVRRNFNPKTLATLGFELEGNQYAMYAIDSLITFLQRGEIKPRLNIERNLTGFWWIALQAGVRANGRFVMVDRYNGKEENEIINTKLGTPFYFNLSLNLVSL
jgi:hypothetical protein